MLLISLLPFVFSVSYREAFPRLFYIASVWWTPFSEPSAVDGDNSLLGDSVPYPVYPGAVVFYLVSVEGAKMVGSASLEGVEEASVQLNKLQVDQPPEAADNGAVRELPGHLVASFSPFLDLASESRSGSLCLLFLAIGRVELHLHFLSATVLEFKFLL